jgi:ATP-dependent DNA ligase
MDLPVLPPILPMLCKPAAELPPAGDVLYEPKWDGFRCIAYRDGDEVELGSRNTKPLTRYFPELVEALKANLPERCVVDGEIVVVGKSGLDFDLLQLRIHPAASRIAMLSEEHPSSFVAFDLLALGDDDLRAEPFRERRRRLEEALVGASPPVHVTPATDDRAVATDWFTRFEGAGLDGVIAKRVEGTYQADKRVLTKVKHKRTADCVVAGFRWHKGSDGTAVGSLLLGLWAGDSLQHIGVIGAFPMATRRALVEELRPLVAGPDDDHPWRHWQDIVEEARADGKRLPGHVSRWNGAKDMSFVLLRPERVVEITYDQLQGDRLRHAGQFHRWRPDRDPATCTYEQLEVVVPEELQSVFAAGT